MISHNDVNPDGNLDDSFNRQNSGNNLLDNSAIGMGGNQPLQSPGGQGGHKPQFNMSDDQIALHDSANHPLGTTVPTMTQSQQQTPLPLSYMGRAVNHSNFGDDFDNMALNGDEPEDKRTHFRGVPITTGPITYT